MNVRMSERDDGTWGIRRARQDPPRAHVLGSQEKRRRERGGALTCLELTGAAPLKKQKSGGRPRDGGEQLRRSASRACAKVAELGTQSRSGADGACCSQSSAGCAPYTHALALALEPSAEAVRGDSMWRDSMPESLSLLLPRGQAYTCTSSSPGGDGSSIT